MPLDDTPLNINAGLPYNRRIRIKGAAKTWPSLDDFEVRCQLRVSASAKSRLKQTLSSYFLPSIDGEDIVLDLKLTGANTRVLPSGYYSVVVSDKGSIDERAIEVLRGHLRVRPMATGA